MYNMLTENLFRGFKVDFYPYTWVKTYISNIFKKLLNFTYFTKVNKFFLYVQQIDINLGLYLH